MLESGNRDSRSGERAVGDEDSDSRLAIGKDGNRTEAFPRPRHIETLHSTVQRAKQRYK